MHGIQIKNYVKRPSDLAVVDLPDPIPARDQYLIEIRATAANFFDLLQISGKYQIQPPFPWISGYEFAGVVLSIPKNLPGNYTPIFQPGDKVFGASQGAYATKIAVKEESIRPIPKGWSFVESAGLFITAPTSFSGLVLRAGIKRGDFVLIHGAAGAVGLAAIQIAKAFGCTVIATASTQHKMDVAKSFGADYVVNYTNPSWPDRVNSITPQKRGVEVVFDSVGLIEKSTKCTRWNGQLVVVGFAAGTIEKLPLNRVLLKNISVHGLHWGAYASNDPEAIRVVWKGIFELIKSGMFRSINYTGKEFVGMQSVPKALELLEKRQAWGKLVIKVGSDHRSKI